MRRGKGAVWPSAQLPSWCHLPARLLHLLSHTQFPGHTKSSSLTACSSKHPGLPPPGRPFSSCKLLFLSQDPRKTLHMSKTSSSPRPLATAPSLIRPLCTQSSLLTLLPSLPLPTRLPNPTWSLWTGFPRCWWHHSSAHERERRSHWTAISCLPGH